MYYVWHNECAIFTALLDDDNIVGYVELMTNDFISRMDLYPWICARYVDEAYRGNGWSERLIKRAKEDAPHMYI